MKISDDDFVINEWLLFLLIHPTKTVEQVKNTGINITNVQCSAMEMFRQKPNKYNLHYVMKLRIFRILWFGNGKFRAYRNTSNFYTYRANMSEDEHMRLHKYFVKLGIPFIHCDNIPVIRGPLLLFRQQLSLGDAERIKNHRRFYLIDVNAEFALPVKVNKSITEKDVKAAIGDGIIIGANTKSAKSLRS